MALCTRWDGAHHDDAENQSGDGRDGNPTSKHDANLQIAGAGTTAKRPAWQGHQDRASILSRSADQDLKPAAQTRPDQTGDVLLAWPTSRKKSSGFTVLCREGIEWP